MTAPFARAQAIAERFQPMSLEQCNARAALQTRVDNKYFVSWSVFEQLADSLRDTGAVLDIEGRRVFAYDSVYFDTALTLYRAHLQGRRRRYKCRSRHYVDSKLCFLEGRVKGRRGERIK